jgi:hypothetical protein
LVDRDPRVGRHETLSLASRRYPGYLVEMMFLGLLLAVNAALHGGIVARFGMRGNTPPAVFGILYAGLAMAVFAGWARAPLIALVVTAVGLLGLGLNFKKLQHDPTIEKIILVVGAAILGCAAYPLLVR